MNGLFEEVAMHDPSAIPAFLGVKTGLAETIQQTLVPSIAWRNSHLEAFGRTHPLEHVGGDLLDLVPGERDVVAYVADVSGHGFRAGLLMGMIKTAMRYGLLLGQSLPTLLDAMNRVLPAVKESSMYATLAALRIDAAGELEYVSAGHLPMLHYRRRRNDVVRCPLVQFPLGLFENISYTSARVRYEPGDVFALVTDGIVETADDRGIEFGLERLELILRSLAGCPLSEMYEQALAAVSRHGMQHDDRTVLLIRPLA